MVTGGFISIKESCHEGWENMSISEKGRFCSSCKKDVHDFSNSGIEEIRRIYLENNGEVCGHIPVKLLQDQYVEQEVQKVHFSFVKKFFIAALFCFGASLFTVDAAKASTIYKLKLSFLQLKDNAKDSVVMIRGVVKDKRNSELLPFVDIHVLHNDTIIARAVTDIDGAYLVKVPLQYSTVDIKAVFVGYQPHMIKGVSLINNSTSHKPMANSIIVDINIEAPEEMMDGIMIYEEPLINSEPGSSGKTIKREEYKRMPK
jgi:hypothetical protein